MAACALVACSDGAAAPGEARRGGAATALPGPEAPISRRPARLAAALTETTRDLRDAIERWRAEGDPRRGGPPREVKLLALYQQRVYLLLTGRRALAAATLGRLPRSVRAEARDTLAARRALVRLVPSTTRRRYRTGRPLPADVLRRLYRRAERRFRVDWEVLAAINFVETAFNRLRNDSTAGARGPMQFIPSTWRAYGLGGDVHRPRDAILGAANYLRASGAPGDYGRALYAYNPSTDYVRAVRRYARRIGRDPRAYYAYYSWQVFVRTPARTVRLTGPGRRFGVQRIRGSASTSTP